ncbi:HAD-IIIA family hydrolase [Calothrix sp. FACHB-156]|nr:HAD-IIIA family hydrolase [Calothrix sp. FACHB-156]
MNKISLTELEQRLSQVKLLALDVDGVLTDGGLYYTETGEELKKFNVKDGMGIKLVIQAGIAVAIITNSTSTCVIHRAKKLGIPHVLLGIEDKLTALKNLCNKLQLDLSQVAYVGDDINDLSVLKAIGCPITVADAIQENQRCAIYVTGKSGGCGAVREVCDRLLFNISYS